MSRRRPEPGAALAGTFLILFGLALTLAGGACTVGWVAFLYWGVESGLGLFGLFMLLVAIVCAGLGCLSIEHGIRFLRASEQGGGDGPDGPAGA